MVPEMKLRVSLLVAAMLLPGCMADALDDVETDSGAELEAESLIGNPRALVNGAAGTCMTVPPANTEDGAEIQVAACNSTSPQRWTFLPRDSGIYQLISEQNGKCLTLASVSTAQGVRLIQWRCDGTKNQLFQPTNSTGVSMQIKSVLSLQCMDLAARLAPNDRGLIQWQCDGAATQRWTQR